MRAFFEAIEDLFVNVLFSPFDFFRFMENWWGANAINWVLVIIGMVAFAYWMGELKKYNDKGEEDKSITSHSYL